MQLQWVLIVTFSNSLAPGVLDYMPTPVPIATFPTYEDCAEAKASFLLMKKDKGVREFFFARADSPPVGAKCLPVGTEAQIKDYIAKHPEEAEKQIKPTRQPGPPNQN